MTGFRVIELEEALRRTLTRQFNQDAWKGLVIWCGRCFTRVAPGEFICLLQPDGSGVAGLRVIHSTCFKLLAPGHELRQATLLANDKPLTVVEAAEEIICLHPSLDLNAAANGRHPSSNGHPVRESKTLVLPRIYRGVDSKNRRPPTKRRSRRPVHRS